MGCQGSNQVGHVQSRCPTHCTISLPHALLSAFDFEEHMDGESWIKYEGEILGEGE